MAKKTWTLCDVDQDIYMEGITLTPSQVGGAAQGYSVAKRTLRGGLRDGVDVIEVDNGSFRFVVVPTRGMGIWNAHGRARSAWDGNRRSRGRFTPPSSISTRQRDRLARRFRRVARPLRPGEQRGPGFQARRHAPLRPARQDRQHPGP